MKWQLNLVTPLLSINAERSMHFHARAKYVKAVRTLAREEAERAGIPHFDRARMVAQPLQQRGTLADIANHLPTIKAAIDGMVDAGVLTDDRNDYLESLLILPNIRWTHTGLSVAVYAAVSADVPTQP
jgi:hypothetical protein